jgi:fatty acid desaturase
MLDYRPMQLQTVAAYAREIRPVLPPGSFAPARSRVLWLPVNATIIAALAWSMATGRLPWFLWPVASLVIGFAMSGVTFLAHETLHGGVVRGRTAIRIVGWFGFLPFLLAPQLWVAWHNRVHHNHTGEPGVDPDMYPTLEEYRTQPGARIMADYFGIGRRRIMSFASILFGFTGQSMQMLFTARRRGFLTPKLHRRAIIETLLGVVFWGVVAVLVGFVPFLFVYLLPLVVANSIAMSFVMTNHNLNPVTRINDPLVNSLSVTLPQPLVWMTLGFGFHVEHHLFPTMSTRHGPAVRDALLAKFPGRYQSMSLFSALAQLYRTARVYQDDTTLIDPPSGATWPTLVPREPQAPEDRNSAN